MAEITKNGITFSADSGSGNASISVSAEVNEGLDYSETFRISASGDAETYADITVNREGRREVFVSDFTLADGTTFNVIKEGYQ